MRARRIICFRIRIPDARIVPIAVQDPSLATVAQIDLQNLPQPFLRSGRKNRSYYFNARLDRLRNIQSAEPM